MPSVRDHTLLGPAYKLSYELSNIILLRSLSSVSPFDVSLQYPHRYTLLPDSVPDPEVLFPPQKVQQASVFTSLPPPLLVILFVSRR